MRKLISLAVACVLAATPAVGQQVGAGQPSMALPELGDASQVSLTPQMERRFGELAMREIRSDPAFVDDPEVSAYLDSVGQRLAAASPDTRQAFMFFVIRDPTINAFAIPGGVIGVHTGLITAAQSESELASVLAHEIAHVTQRHMARQVAAQQQMQPIALLALVLGILAARSNPQAAQAAIVGSQAGMVQSMLNYSRDFEREADRVGFQILQQGGYDVNGMPSFFERLQRWSRLYENNAPAYLRSHPLTSERIADMQGRAQEAPYRQTPDPLDFQLVRAKLRAEAGTPEQAVVSAETVMRERRFTDEAAARYGYARALLRAKDVTRASAEVAALRKLGLRDPMIENLAAEVKRDAGDLQGARNIYADAMKEYPGNMALRLGYVDTLQRLGQNTEALAILESAVKAQPREPRVWSLQAKSYGALGKRTLQHRSLAELYYLQGSISAAIEQLQLARAAGDGDFYTLSGIDARLREFRVDQVEEAKEMKNARR